MNESELEHEFWRLCQIADSADTLEASVPDLEPPLLNILNFVKAHPDQREVLARCFQALVDGSRTYTDWIVLFCMRELRWSEVREAANRRFEVAGGVHHATDEYKHPPRPLKHLIFERQLPACPEQRHQTIAERVCVDEIEDNIYKIYKISLPRCRKIQQVSATAPRKRPGTTS